MRGAQGTDANHYSIDTEFAFSVLFFGRAHGLWEFTDSGVNHFDNGRGSFVACANILTGQQARLMACRVNYAHATT